MIIPWMNECHMMLKLDFPEYLFLVQDVGDDHPDRYAHQILDQVLSVRLAVFHLPAKREVIVKNLVTHIHQDRVHT